MKKVACHDCDLIVDLPRLEDGQCIYCPRCGHLLMVWTERGLERSAAYALAGAVFLVTANLFPFLSFRSNGREQVMTLAQSALELYHYDNQFLAAAVLAFIIFLPAVIIFILIGMLVPLVFKGYSTRKAHLWGRVIFLLGPWCMVEIFLVAVLVSLTKIATMATVELGLSFWAYLGFVICFILALASLDWVQFWESVEKREGDVVVEGTTAAAVGLASCQVCNLLTPVSARYCPRCTTLLHLRIPFSLQRTIALLLTSAVLYLPANLLPIMWTERFGSVTESTILGGVILMWEDGSYGVALIIFIASVFIPIAKLLALGWLCWSVGRGYSLCRTERTVLYRITEFIGRWSMVDIFVVAILVALIQLGSVFTIRPGSAALAFAGVVIITMLAAKSFDPRLIWDKLERYG